MKSRHTRTYRLDGIYSAGCLLSIESALSSLAGVAEVHFDYDRRTAKISYDLMQVTSQRIEEMLEMAGYSVSNSIWQRIRLGWVHYTEQNMLDNLQARPTDCCSNPRTIVQK